MHQMYNGLTWQEKRKLREEYVSFQDGLCWYCSGRLDAQPPTAVTNKKINWKLFPPNFLKYPVHLQHDHSTGLTEGAVHSYCNAVLWQYHKR
jgi:hypothetical protein